MQILKKIWIELIIGAILGFFILHPISMFLAQGKEGVAMFFHHDFLHMLLGKMSWYFTILGLLIGFVSGISRVKLHSKNILLTKQKEEIQLKNTELEQQKEEIQSQSKKLIIVNKKIVLQHDKIKKQNDDITASINYAKSIQSAILPNDASLTTIIHDMFVVFKPKSVVSGDFYWVEKKDEKIFIAAVDCTGHGVPGAFMSIIGKGILDKIIKELQICEPDEILFHLDQQLRLFLKQDLTNNNDGMDIALCVIDKARKTLKFSGAKNPLVVIENEEIKVVKGDRNSIGGHRQKKQTAFTCHELNYSINTMFYIFSDGFQDQFGGAKNVKYKQKRMINLFSEIVGFSVLEQKLSIENEFEKWKGNYTQIDDILILGFKL